MRRTYGTALITLKEHPGSIVCILNASKMDPRIDLSLFQVLSMIYCTAVLLQGPLSTLPSCIEIDESSFYTVTNTTWSAVQHLRSQHTSLCHETPWRIQARPSEKVTQIITSWISDWSNTESKSEVKRVHFAVFWSTVKHTFRKIWSTVQKKRW